MSDEPIWIVTRSEETSSGGKGWGEELTRRLSDLSPKPVNPEKLKLEWKRTMGLIGQLIQQAEQEAGGHFGMKLDEVTLAVEINGKGQVNLLGACSSEASGKGAITLKFKRAELE